MSSFATITHAAVDANRFGSLIDPIISVIVNPVLGLMFAIATVYFVYGVVQYIMSGDDGSESRQKFKDAIMWGLIGMFIMVSAWGIIKVISNTIKTI